MDVKLTSICPFDINVGVEFSCSSYVRFSVDRKLAYLASNLHYNGWTSISHLWTSKWDSRMQWMSNEHTTIMIYVHLKNLWLKIDFQKLYYYLKVFWHNLSQNVIFILIYILQVLSKCIVWRPCDQFSIIMMYRTL